MHQQLPLLVTLQDLDLMIADARNPMMAEGEESLGFRMEGLEKLEKAREEIAQRLDPALLRLYERVSKRYDRAVVPVVGLTCMGCFGSLPTAITSASSGGRSAVKTCQSCGRILYWL